MRRRKIGSYAPPSTIRSRRLPLRTISHLIARASIRQYRRAVRAVKADGEFRFLLIGPRAPYSFCSLAGEPVGTHGMNLAD